MGSGTLTKDPKPQSDPSGFGLSKLGGLWVQGSVLTRVDLNVVLLAARGRSGFARVSI